MSTRKKYRLLSGLHSDPDIVSPEGSRNKGSLFKAGDIIETDMDLIGHFPNKFILVHEEPSAGTKLVNEKDFDEFLRWKQQQSGTVQADLSEEEIPKKKARAKVEDEVKEEDDDDGTDTIENDTANIPASLGEDVTDEFEKAQDADVKVFRNDKGEYFIVDSDDPTTPLNEVIFTNKKQVTEFCKRYTDKE